MNSGQSADVACLQAIPRSKASDYVFPADANPKRHYGSTPKVWERIRKAADLPNVRLHNLRHTVASLGAAGDLRSHSRMGEAYVLHLGQP